MTRTLQLHLELAHRFPRWMLAPFLLLGCGDDGGTDGSGETGSASSTESGSSTTSGGSASSGGSGSTAGTGSASGGSSGGTDSAGTSSGSGGTSGGSVTCDDTQVFCNGPTPDCPGSTVPEVENGCYTGDCIEITSCPGYDPYASCEGCGAGTECVSWSECVGDSCTPYAQSCNEPPAGCQGSMTCACAAAAVCGMVSGFSCFDRPAGGIFCCEGDPGTCGSAGG